MKTSINKLLQELYQIDPELQRQEAQIVKILEKMTLDKPDTHFDETFRNELKTKLLAEISDSRKMGKEINWKAILTGFFAGGSAIGFA